MAKLLAGIDYSNFKSAVSSTNGSARAEVYGHVWGELYRLQGGRFEEIPADARLI
jgi:hypothetical protein